MKQRVNEPGKKKIKCFICLETYCAKNSFTFLHRDTVSPQNICTYKMKTHFYLLIWKVATEISTQKTEINSI